MNRIRSLKTQLRAGFSSQISADIELCNLDFSEYYKLLDSTLQDWNEDIHEEIFLKD